MGYPEAKYIVDTVVSNAKKFRSTGFPPQSQAESCYQELTVTSGESIVTIKFTPHFTNLETVIENQVVCTTFGARIIRKAGEPPVDGSDGVFIRDVANEESVTIVDSDLENEVTYYYGFYPVSDHGVTAKDGKVVSAFPKLNYYGFHQDFSDLNPDTCITYLKNSLNSGYSRMSTIVTSTSASQTYSSYWASFIGGVLKLTPFMVRRDGTQYERLYGGDYSKFGSVYTSRAESEANNPSFDGFGCFVWINKIYMKEVYAEDGMSRDVYFADHPIEGFYPVGFVNEDGKEVKGLFIPMGYMNIFDGMGKVILNGTALPTSMSFETFVSAIRATYQEGTTYKNTVTAFSGPILNVLRDLCYMMFKSTNIQAYGGYGGSGIPLTYYGDNVLDSAYSITSSTNRTKYRMREVGFLGTLLSAITNNTMFHSILLGSYLCRLMDISIGIGKSGKIRWNEKYENLLEVDEPEIFKDSYETDHPDHVLSEKVSTNDGTTLFFPAKLKKVSDTYGSIPDYDSEMADNRGSSSTGLCDACYILDPNYAPEFSDSNDSYVIGTRFGTQSLTHQDGPGNLSFAQYRSMDKAGLVSISNDRLSYTPMIIPDPDYTPLS